MKRTARLLLVCLVFASLAASHNAFARTAKAVVEQVNVTTQQASQTPVAAQAGVTTKKVGQMVNLNSASVNELAQLPGIGSVKAAAIVDKRTELGGKFTSLDQLLTVKGIKEKTLEKIKPLLSL